jgi:hypothetical protein
MAVTVEETKESRSAAAGESPSIDLVYTIKGTADESVALANLLATAPLTYGVGSALLTRLTTSVAPVFVDTGNAAGSMWEGTVKYGKFTSKPKNVDEESWNFEIGTGSVHITQAKEVLHRYVAAGGLPNYGGAIGVSHDKVEGCDVDIPTYTWSETHRFDAGDCPSKMLIYWVATHPVNDGTFRDFPAGAVRFLGVSGAQRGDGVWELTYRFAASPNIGVGDAMMIGGIGPVEKNGWEYLWVRYDDDVDNTAKCIVKKPVYVEVDRVYDTSDFADLGIGIDPLP